MEGLEKFIQNKDICEMQGCCPATASKIIKMLKETYGISDDELPDKNKIPLSAYQYHFRKKPPAEWARRKREREREQKEKDA